MSRFVEVPRAAFEERLVSAGFSRVQGPGEVCYHRLHHHDPRFSVVVWTSIPIYSTSTRDCGTDAIRVLARLSWTRWGEDVPRHKTIYKTRVYRVGTAEGVLERTMERAREAYRAINQELNEPKRSVRA